MKLTRVPRMGETLKTECSVSYSSTGSDWSVLWGRDTCVPNRSLLDKGLVLFSIGKPLCLYRR